MRVSIFGLAFLSFVTVAPLAAQPAGSDASAVSAVVSAFHAGLRAGDAAAVMQLIADDALILEAGGVETRAEYGKNHLPADIEFEKVVTSTRGPVRLVVNGSSAWATTSSEYRGTFQGRAIDSLGIELMVLSRDASGWRIRAIHWSSRARKPAQ